MLTAGWIMAKPDCDDGWFKLAHELAGAMEVADFTKAERVVLRFVFLQVFGPARRKLAELSPTDIARRAGMQKQNVDRAIKSLVAGGTLQHRGGRLYRFVKDYDQWTRNGAPRLSPAERAWVAGNPALAMWYQQDPMSSGEMTDKETPCKHVIQRDDGLSSNEMTKCHPTRLQNVISLDDANTKTKTKTEKGREKIARAPSESPASSEPDDEPFVTPDAGPLKGPTGQRSRQAAELKAKYDAYGEMPGPGGRALDSGITYGEWAARQCDEFDPAWIDRVLDHILRREGQRKNARYLLTILEGGPGNFHRDRKAPHAPERPRPEPPKFVRHGRDPRMPELRPAKSLDNAPGGRGNVPPPPTRTGGKP